MKYCLLFLLMLMNTSCVIFVNFSEVVAHAGTYKLNVESIKGAYETAQGERVVEVRVN